MSPADDWQLGQNAVDVRNEAIRSRMFACDDPEGDWIADQRADAAMEERLDLERDLDDLRRRQAEVLATPPLTEAAGRRRIDWLKRTYAEEQRLLALLEDE